MKKLLVLFSVMVLIIAAFTGCERKHQTEIQNLLTELEPKIESLYSDADAMYGKGIIDSELYNQTLELKSKFDENKELFVNTKGNKDSKILKALNECSETAAQLQTEVDESYGECDNIRNYALGLLKDAKNLGNYMESGLKKGYVNTEVYNEYKQLVSELEGITQNMYPDSSVNDRLDSIKQRLAVMSSQSAAPNDVVDLFITNVAGEEEEEPTDEAADNGSSLKSVTDNFTALQNEASQSVDKGGISEEDYTALLQAGTKLAKINEDAEKSGENDDIAKRLDECKKEIHTIAVKINSSLASKFE